MSMSATYCVSNLPYGYCSKCGIELEAVHYCVNGYTLCKNCNELYGEQCNNTIYTKREGII